MFNPRVKKNQLDAQIILSIRLILSIFRLLFWLDWNNPTRTTDSHLKMLIIINCYIHTVVPPDYGLGYARKM